MREVTKAAVKEVTGCGREWKMSRLTFRFQSWVSRSILYFNTFPQEKESIIQQFSFVVIKIDVAKIRNVKLISNHVFTVNDY